MTGQRIACRRALLAEGWRDDITLRVDAEGFIAAIERGFDPDAERLIDATVLPGMVNAHSHIHQRLIAGLTGRRHAERDSFWSWREQMYRAVELLDGPAFTALAAHAFMELLEGGFTTTGEFHYPHRIGERPPQANAQSVLQAAADAGCALTLLPVWYRYGGFGRRPLEPRQSAFALSFEELLGLVDALRPAERDPRLRLGVAPHSLRAVDAADLHALLEAVPTGPVHIHIAEQPAEVDACLEAHGCRPIEWLLDHVEPDARWCLIHATHAAESEWRALAGRDCVVCLCPTTEADLGDGLFPAREFIDAGGRLAIGSDSNLVTSAVDELRLLEWGQRLRRHERNVLIGDEATVGTALWRRSARAGAQALGQPAGELAPGRRADLVVLADDHPLLEGLPAGERMDTLVFSNAPGLIDQVWVAGEQRVAGGRHVDRDRLTAPLAGWRKTLSGAVS